jgi:ABC-type nitrate/sulfonate/bicarbonate transport system substrate-binding protein
MPWRDAIAQLAAEGVDVAWQDFPGGTGAMAQAVRDGQLDVAIMLTEGAVAAIGDGLDARIAATYVGSPLLWGIHASAHSDIEEPEDLRGGVYAISRYGSGSELMALVDARIRQWPVDELQFEVIRNFDGARAALAEGRADVFFWERFMTKPTVDSGEFKLVGVRPTPWPSFMVVATKDLLTSSYDLDHLLTRVRAAAERLAADPETTADRISKVFGIARDDAQEWMTTTDWTVEPFVEKAALEDVASYLEQAGRLRPEFDVADAVTADIAASWATDRVSRLS